MKNTEEIKRKIGLLKDDKSRILFYLFQEISLLHTDIIL